MSYYNVPDDWNAYYRRCEICGTRYHASEGGCECQDGNECDWCGETKDWDAFGGVEEANICNECRECDICGKDTDENARYYVILTGQDFDPENPPLNMMEVYCLECAQKHDDKIRFLVKVDK